MNWLAYCRRVLASRDLPEAKKLAARAAWGLAIAPVWLGASFAQAPSFKVDSASLVSPSQAVAYYGSGVTHTDGLCGLASGLCNPTPLPQMQELVRSLSHGQSLAADQYAQNAYDYVRLNVRTEFRYGLSKGGDGALIEQSGTPFDKAQLLVNLFQLKGIAASYQLGTIQLSSAQFVAWTGISDAKAACRLLADGGVPAQINGVASANCNYSGPVSDVVMSHIWVIANGKLYDPAYQVRVVKPGVDLASVLGCGSAGAVTCGATAIASALPGGSVGYDAGAQASYVQGVSESALASTLSASAANLQHYIQANMPGAQIEDVVGGALIDVSSQQIASAALSYTATPAMTVDKIPDQYRTAFGLQIFDANISVFADEAKRYQLNIRSGLTDGAGNGSPVVVDMHDLYVLNTNGDVPIFRPSLNNFDPHALTAQISLSVNHPYADRGGGYMDDMVTKLVDFRPPQNQSGTPIFPISVFFQLGDNDSVNQSYLDFAIQGGGKSKIYNSWMVQARRGTLIVDAINKTRTTHHHSFGTIVSVMYTNDVTDAVTSVSVSSELGVEVSRSAAIAANAAVFAAIEGSVYQQKLDTSADDSAISLFHLANQKSIRLYEVNRQNLEAVLASTTNYGAIAGIQEKDFVRSYFDPHGPDFSAIVAQNGDVGQFGPGGAMGAIYILIAPMLAYTADSSQIAYVSTYRNKGGGGQAAVVDPSAMPPTPGAMSYGRPYQIGVDGASGSATVTFRPDLVTGSGAFPHRLSVERTLRTYSEGGLAGWEEPHNNTVQAQFANDALKALGQDSALDASGVISALLTLSDLGRASNFQARVVAAYTGYWFSQRLSGNVVVVQRGAARAKFGKLPDGTFSSPNGISERLVQSGARVPYPSSFGFKYTYSGASFALYDASGSRIDFGWGGCGSKNTYYTVIDRNCYAATKWTMADGSWASYEYADLNFGGPQSDLVYLPPAQLQKITNSDGRSLSWVYGVGILDGAFDVNNYTVMDENRRSLKKTTVLYGSAPDLPASTFRNSYEMTGPGGEKYGYYEDVDTNAPSVARTRFFFSDQKRPQGKLLVDQIGRASIVVDANGHMVTYFPSQVTFAERKTIGYVVDALGASTVSEFDSAGQPTRLVDPLGRVTTRSYDAAHRLVLTVSPEGDSEARTYDARSNVLSVIRRAKPGSGLSDLVSTTTYGEGPSVLICANPKTCNKPVGVMDARGWVINYVWDGATGNLIQELKPTDASGQRPQTDYGYSSFGTGFTLLTSKTDKVSASQSLTTTYAYNSSSKYVLQSSTVDPAGYNLTTSYSFDSIGNLTTVDGPRTDVADVTNYTWDADRRLTMTIQPQVNGTSQATRYRYDADGQLIYVDSGVATQANGSDFVVKSTTATVYDAVGNKVRTTSPTGEVSEFAYDADDRLQCTAVRMGSGLGGACSGINAGDRISQTVYDAAGQTLQTLQAVGTSDQRTYATYTYSPNGKQTSIKDANGNLTSLVYDGFDRLTQQIFPSTTRGAGVSNPADYEAYSYDANGNRTSLRKRDGKTFTYDYDALNREIVKHSPDGPQADVYTGYDLAGRKLYALYASIGGSGITYSYDTAGRMTSETTFGRSMSFQYDPASNRTRITWPDTAYGGYVYDAMNRVAWAQFGSHGMGINYDGLGRRSNISRITGANTSYAFDASDRLTGLSHDPAGTAYDVGWTLGYNPAGQVASRSLTNSLYAWNGHPSGTKNTTADGLNRDADIAAVAGGYDANGNLTFDGVRTFTYDAENRLTSVSGVAGQPAMTLSYDPNGRLWQTSAGGSVTQFVYDGDRLTAEYDGSGNVLRRYLHGPGVDEPLIWYEGAALNDPRYLHADRQGSIVAWSDSGGNVAQTYAYGPYGEPSSWTGSRFRYTGQIALPQAQLYYYKARVYDPIMGRFLQTDPVGYKDDLDLYAYVGGDPVNKADPTGLVSCVARSNGGQTCESEVKTSPLGALIAVTAATTWNAGVRVYEAVTGRSESRSISEAASTVASKSETDKRQEYTVRVQAQGTGLQRKDDSITITRDRPVTVREVNLALTTLAGRMNPGDRKELGPAFIGASIRAGEIAAAGGLPPVGSISTPGRSNNATVGRVDLELLRGPVNIVR